MAGMNCKDYDWVLDDCRHLLLCLEHLLKAEKFTGELVALSEIQLIGLGMANRSEQIKNEISEHLKECDFNAE